MRISEDMHSPYSFYITSDHNLFPGEWEEFVFYCVTCIMIWVIENAEHSFAFVFSCSEILFVIRRLLSLTVMEGKQSLTHKKGLMRKVRWMSSSLEQKLVLRNRIKQATKPGQGEHPKWDLAQPGSWCCTVSLFQAMHGWLHKGKKSSQMIPFSV